MGYFGAGSFENDDAMDWLSSQKHGIGGASLKKVFQKYNRYLKSGQKADRLTKAQIEELIAMLLESWAEDPPAHWKKDGPSLQRRLREEEEKLRDEYYSGRYLDQEYGPVEPVLAAAELVAAWAGWPQNGDYPKEASRLLKKCEGKPPLSLVQAAADSVALVLKNGRYRRMRCFFLSAFPKVSGGDDQMKAVRDLFSRLKVALKELGKS